MRAPGSPYLHQYLLLPIFFIRAILVGVMKYFIVLSDINIQVFNRSLEIDYKCQMAGEKIQIASG